jgi:peptide/nickel transport system permease protein
MCLLVLVFLLALAIAPQLFASGDPTAAQPRVRFQPPDMDHPFGTDYLGRDIYTRIVYGARLSLFPAIAVVIMAGILGSIAGLIAGYTGGWIDEALMRFTDVFLAVPALILAMAIATALGPSVMNAALAVVLVWWPGFARLARGETQVIRRTEYVEAAAATGAGAVRIMLRHVLPNISASLIVKLSLDAGTLLLGRRSIDCGCRTGKGAGRIGLGASAALDVDDGAGNRAECGGRRRYTNHRSRAGGQSSRRLERVCGGAGTAIHLVAEQPAYRPWCCPRDVRRTLTHGGGAPETAAQVHSG